MALSGTSCFKSVGGSKICNFCNDFVIKNGKSKSGNQRYVSKNGFKIAKSAAVYGAERVAEHYLNKVPGLEPTLKNIDGEEVMNLGNKILQQNASLKIMGVDRYIDAKTEKE